MNRFTHNKLLDPLFEKKIFQYVWNSVKLGRIQKRLLVIISSSTTATVPLNRCHDDAVVESGDRFSPTRCRADLRSAVVFLLLPLFLPSFSFPWMIFHEPTCCWSFFLFTKWFLPRLFCRRIERGTLLTRHRVDLRLCVLFLFFLMFPRPICLRRPVRSSAHHWQPVFTEFYRVFFRLLRSTAGGLERKRRSWGGGFIISSIKER